MPGSTAPSLSPSETGRPPGIQPMHMAVLQGAHFLQETSAGNAENQLENQVLHKASSLGLCCKKKSEGVQHCELLILKVFPNQRGHKVLCQGPHARLSMWADSLVPANEDRM